jgi:thioredoxin 1
MAFRDGILLYKEAGALPKEALGQLVEQVKALDMDDVRRQVAEAEAAAGHDHAGHDHAGHDH